MEKYITKGKITKRIIVNSIDFKDSSFKLALKSNWKNEQKITKARNPIIKYLINSPGSGTKKPSPQQASKIKGKKSVINFFIYPSALILACKIT